MEQSLFAITLQRLLDETGVFNRTDWAKFLGVTEEAIGKWLSDELVPRADLLHMLYSCAARAAPHHDAIDRFEEMASSSSAAVTPHWKTMRPTVWKYMCQNGMDFFGKNFRAMTPEDRNLLFEGSIRGT
jgi:hypothetical protein